MSDMKCPFCGAKLQEFGGGDFPMMHYCDNINCNLYHIMGQYTLWQAIIDGKKAQDALKGIEIRVAAIRGCVQDGYTQLGERNRNIFIALELFKDLIKEITSITKQDE